jgi:lysophospholipase L1-like esterase
MKHLLLICSIILLFSCKEENNKPQEPIKIACVGNSITYGYGVANREKNSYPKQLQYLLGNEYKVENFGNSGATLLQKGNKPYNNTNTYKEALAFNPDVVVVALGTNDSKLANRDLIAQNFEDDYKKLIDAFKAKNPKVRVLVNTVLPSFLEDSTLIWNTTIKEKINPLVKKVAVDTNSELVDLYPTFENEKRMFPDKVHPNGLGQRLIAKHVYAKIIKEDIANINFAIKPMPSPEYRSAAGWTQGADWWVQAADIDSLCQVSKDIDVLFIGNSITQGFGSRPHVPYAPGGKATSEKINHLKWVNGGISGDRTQHILWRLRYGNYQAANPKTVVLAIGVNNFKHNTASEIVLGIKEVIKTMKATFKPSTKILLFGPLPTGTEPSSSHRQKFRAIHESIKSLGDDKQIIYANLESIMVDDNGVLNSVYYSGDGIHLRPKGYEVWINNIVEILSL